MSYTLGFWPAIGSPPTKKVSLNSAMTWLGSAPGNLVQRIGPLATLVTRSSPRWRPPLHPTAVDAAFHEVDTAQDRPCVALGLRHVAADVKLVRHVPGAQHIKSCERVDAGGAALVAVARSAQAYPGGGLTTGFLALVGGEEFKPGNDAHARLLLEHRGVGPAYVVPTAAARQRPDLAVATAQRWFTSFGLEVVELPVLKRSDASLATNVELAERGGLFYLTGGDPGLVVDVLRDSPVWRAIVAAWQRGAALAGSSAGAMALGEWTLIRKAYPGHAARRSKPALELVPRVAVAPHFETFGHRWVDSVLEEPPAEDVVFVGIDQRSAALWDGREWTARGPGRITVVTRRDRAVSQSGTPVQLPAPRLASAG